MNSGRERREYEQVGGHQVLLWLNAPSVPQWLVRNFAVASAFLEGWMVLGRALAVGTLAVLAGGAEIVRADRGRFMLMCVWLRLAVARIRRPGQLRLFGLLVWLGA